MVATFDRTKLAVRNEYGHFNRRVLTHGDIKRFIRRESDARTVATNLPKWDLWGYAIAYYVGTPATVGYSSQWTGFVDGEIAVRDLTGDVLCGDCVATMVDPWEVVYVAYQINGEVGDMETVYCCHCNTAIYEAPED
jgi:hypothetical protein